VADYRNSILLDLDGGIRRARDDPVYLVLNACRVLAFLQEGKVLSKLEGGSWGMRALPLVFTPLLEAAMESYQGVVDVTVDEVLLTSFVEEVKRKCGGP
jgi:streptomycin 3"-adenylyltransferase